MHNSWAVTEGELGVEFDGDSQQAALHNRLSGDETGLHAQQQIYIPSAGLSLSARLTVALYTDPRNKTCSTLSWAAFGQMEHTFRHSFAVCSETGSVY